MPARKKTLTQLVRDRTFLARRHADRLLEEPLVHDPGLRALQIRYRDETSALERRALALSFEKAVHDPLDRALHAATVDEAGLERSIAEERRLELGAGELEPDQLRAEMQRRQDAAGGGARSSTTAGAPTPRQPRARDREIPQEGQHRFSASVQHIESALADLPRRHKTELTPVEKAHAEEIRRLARRAAELGEQLAAEGLMVQGSRNQPRPHPLIDGEIRLSRAIAEQLRKLELAVYGRARVERLNAMTRGRPT